jgi:hypothetical protein
MKIALNLNWLGNRIWPLMAKQRQRGKTMSKRLRIIVMAITAMLITGSCKYIFLEVERAEKFMQDHEEFLLMLVNLEPSGLRKPEQIIELSCWEIGRSNATFTASIYENGLRKKYIEHAEFFADTSKINYYHRKMNDLGIWDVGYYSDRVTFSVVSNKIKDSYSFTIVYYRDSIPSTVREGYARKIWNEHFLIKP